MSMEDEGYDRHLRTRCGWPVRWVTELRGGAHFYRIYAIKPPGEPERIATYARDGRWSQVTETTLDLVPVNMPQPVELVGWSKTKEA